MKKELSNEELENVSGGTWFQDGICLKCGKTFKSSKGLEPVYIPNGCHEGWWKYYCDVCGGEIEYTWIDNDPSC